MPEPPSASQRRKTKQLFPSVRCLDGLLLDVVFITAMRPLSLRPGARGLRSALLTSGMVVGMASPATAGLLMPVLQLMRPQLESRLTQICVQAASVGAPSLGASLQDPCRKLAAPTSRCLIEETDRTGRGLGVLTEMVGGRFGDDSEVVVKRCLARLLGLPVDSLRDVPLRDLARRFGTLGTLAPTRPPGVP
ncbi:MAG: hypothetical protein VKO39_06415 [Cyanobacteriota bacterium]|nr:hypothetical protein [Cyanobacteriota bacterium]